MSVFDRIATLVPSNRAAAIGMQVGIGEPDLTPEQMRENLVAVMAKLERDLAATKGTECRKGLIAQKLALQNQLTDLRKAIRPSGTRDVSNYILDVVKERTPRAVWLGIVREAERRFAEDAAMAGRKGE